MKTIYKYSVRRGIFTVDMPREAKLLSVQLQRGVPVVWAIVETTNAPERRILACLETGGFIDPSVLTSMSYVGTFQMHDGDLVMHLFDCGVEKVAG